MLVKASDPASEQAMRLEGPLVGLRDEMGTRTSETLMGGLEPALLHVGSVIAVAKPAGWEVWGGHHPRQLWQHLQAVEGLRHGILRDAEHGHGFVHRLDVPGSGLVLFACSYEAYYDLKLQLALGQLERRYTVLSHGLATSRNVTAHVHWKDRGPKGIRELPSVSGGRGKPCGTEIVLRTHGFKEGRALSLLTIRIRTGRRHQIRSHCAHIGHPTVYDGKYSTFDTSFGDAKWCEQNCLHRFQLLFRSREGLPREMLAPLPEPFAKLLETLETKNLEQSWGTL
ncbi:rluC [Symbiodinium sp. CCMP2456]|nr:rluC [Symbiodinium sp. CCMP2456]